MKVGPFYGIDNSSDPRQIKSGGLSQARNVDFDDQGWARVRDGVALSIPADAPHSLMVIANRLYFREADALYCSDGHQRWRVADGFAIGRPLRRVTVGLRHFAADGLRAVEITDAWVLPWGIERPSSPLVSVAGGALPTGRYLCAATALRQGDESAPSVLAEVTLAESGGLTITVFPHPDASVEQQRVFLSRVDGVELMAIGEVPAYGGTLTIAIEPSFGAVLSGFDKEPPPAGNLLAAHHSRALVAWRNFLFFSDAFAPDRFDRLRQMVPFGSAIRLLAPLDDGVFVGTEDGLWYLAGADIEAAQINKVSNAVPLFGSGILFDGRYLGQDGVAGYAWLIATESGCMALVSGGQVLGLSDHYRMPGSHITGAAFRDAGWARLVLITSLS